MNIKHVGSRCVGCGACTCVCPVSAITMKQSEDGFDYPSIDSDKCINCGLCARACPALFSSFKPDVKEPLCFAAYANDSEAMRSSSGGIFGVFAEWFLNNGGHVCGAAFDEDWSVKHIIVSSVEDLEKLRVSKYVQSKTGNVFIKIKELLDSGKSVLFSGTSCQVAGLYGFLKRDYDNLLTCDVFCHGVPSPVVWQRYLKEISKGRKIIGINFRDKKNISRHSAHTFDVTIRFSNGDVITTPNIKNTYVNGFLQNLYLRKSCSTCKFTKKVRSSDISIGDFWGYQHIDKKRDVSRGLSAVLLNTDKGIAFFDSLKEKMNYLVQVKFSDVVGGNPVLKAPFKAHDNRDNFINQLSNGSKEITKLINDNLEDKKVAILNFSSKSDYNYGASLVGYALENIVSKLGYIPSTVCFIPEYDLYKKSEKQMFWKFQNTFLNVTGICTSKEALQKNINSNFNKFIIGSDQIIRHPWHENFVYYLDWVYGNKTLLAYAPSFGKSELGMPRKYKKYAKNCLNRFDALSVREHSGADIFAKDFGVKNVPVVCDPTMLLDAEDYQPIIEHDGTTLPDEEYVAYYLLDASEDVLSELGKKYILINAYRDEENNYRSIGQWLNIIKHAKYVITDSFHGTVFSIIFKRQFITLTTFDRGNDRIDTLMHLVGENRLIEATTIVNESEHFGHALDYKKIGVNVEHAKREGIEFLTNALAIKPKKKAKIMRNKRFWLLGFIPMFSIKKNKGYVFKKIEIGKIKEF